MKIKDATSSAVESIQATPKRASKAARAAVGGVATGSRKARDSALSLADGLLSTTQGLLASDLSRDLNGLLHDMVKGSATIYDKATKNVSVVQIAEFMAERAKAASVEMKKLADSRIGTS